MLHVTDKQIKEDLLRELRHLPRLAAMPIEVSVHDYVVTLTGTVKSCADGLLVYETARQVEGVHSVVNNLNKVELPAPCHTDAELARAVRQVLEWDAVISDEDIRSTVSNGWVGLEGKVKLSREREDAERIVRRLAGVRGVYNNIVVDSSEMKTENESDSIEQALRRRAEIEARSIQISPRNGAVMISGRVQSWEERCTIINAASRAPGVVVVKDCLTVQPF